MKNRSTFIAVVLCSFMGMSDIGAQDSRPERLELIHADLLTVILGAQDTTIVSGSVCFKTNTGTIRCDSAVWVKGVSAHLVGNVRVVDQEYQLTADTVDYDLTTQVARARGQTVELWSKPDSLFAVGTNAVFSRKNREFDMQARPTLYVNYPDTANMIEILSDEFHYDGEQEVADANGRVVITSKDIRSESGCATFYPRRNLVDLFDSPRLTRGRSEIAGHIISIQSDDNEPRFIDIIDSAHANFYEPVDSGSEFIDESRLRAKRIQLHFEDGELASVFSYGQAVSWYSPSPRGSIESVQNEVSGDTIRFLIDSARLEGVEVVGGAEGTYVSTKTRPDDTTTVTIVDSIDYSASRIHYQVTDSLITLLGQAEVSSGSMALEAHQIQFETDQQMIYAYSADLPDTLQSDPFTITTELQPNTIPVVLRDKDDVLYGDYLEYSIETEKGRIRKSKSKYETGFFYGEKLFREQRDIFYLQEGRYTTCDAPDPHFHFYSENLKLIENDRLIAKPVVMSIGRLPILAIPYYIFPLKKGRRSGILPFSFGNIERGDRYIRNVGYYFAPSDYWDAQVALDYYERANTINLYNKVSYRKLYSFDGSFDGNVTREISYNSLAGRELQETRWTLRASHNHDFTPDFRVTSFGQFQSDPGYYNDYSTDLRQRLNRTLSSRANFTKRFTKTISLSGLLSNERNLDTETRTTTLPTLSLSLPAIRPFGAGRKDATGRLEQKWFNQLALTYRPSLVNSIFRGNYDSIYVYTLPGDTTFDTLRDTISTKSYRKFARVDHSLSASLPLTVAKYFVLSPSANYTENWFYIGNTDQSRRAGLANDQTYRTYLYSAGVSLRTKLYGTVYPGVFGLNGLRQTLEPVVGYSYTPKIDRHPDVRRFTGSGVGSTRESQSLNLSLNQYYQARVGPPDKFRTLDLLSVTTSTSYNFEAAGRKFSDITTSITSNALPRVNFYGNLRHSLYGTGNSTAVSAPRLLEFDFNASFTLSGSRFLFDDVMQQVARDTSVVGAAAPRRGWRLSAAYGYDESGRGTDFYFKSSFIRFTLDFNLTPSTSVNYSQYYNISDAKTINSQVNITKNLHCWTANFYWVPVGSNKGYGFRIFVTAIPAIKLDNSANNLSSGYFQALR